MPADSRFDLDLKFGQDGEQWVKMLGQEVKIEVKTERDKWNTTRNIFFEYRYRGKPSGLAVTQCDYWATVLSFQGRKCGMFLFEINALKRNLKRLLDDPDPRVKRYVRKIDGGDNNASKGVLVSLQVIWMLYTADSEFRPVIVK